MDKLKSGRTAWTQLLCVTALLMLLLAACAKQAPPVEPDEPVEDIGEVVEEAPPAPEPEPEPQLAAVLTGLPVAELNNARPIAVIVNNFAAARPQSGLTHADVLWEVLAEGGITRIVAIFQSDSFTDMIGPVRSIRPYLIELGEMYHGVLAHAGGSPDGYAILQKQKKPYLDEISNAGPWFWREKFRKAPHNLYTNLEKLREGSAKKKYDAEVTIPVFPFAQADAVISGEPATQLEVRFLLKNYKVSYTYDDAAQLYKRFVNGEPHTDLNDESQLAATNLVILGTKHKVLDKEGRLAVDLEMGGEAKVFMQGKAMDARWERSDDGMIRIRKDGSEIAFLPGKTFYHIVPLDKEFTTYFDYQ